MTISQHPWPGSWKMTIQSGSGSEPNLSFVTLCSDGALIASPPTVERFPLAPGGVIQVSAGHGRWQPIGMDQAILAFEAQAVLANGEVIGIGRIEGDLKLEEDERFSGTYTFAIWSTSGETIATDTGRVDGRRITVERKLAAVEMATAN